MEVSGCGPIVGRGHTGSGAHPASYPMGTDDKAPRPASSAEI
jgi:hypothetical protein